MRRELCFLPARRCQLVGLRGEQETTDVGGLVPTPGKAQRVPQEPGESLGRLGWVPQSRAGHAWGTLG